VLLLPLAAVATPFGSRGSRPAAGGAAVLELEAPPRTHTRTRCAPTSASAPHPLRSRAAPLAARPRAPPLRHPCSLSHPSCTLPAPFLHPSLCRCRRARSRAQSMCRSVAPQASSLSLPPREKVLRLFFWVNGLDQIHHCEGSLICMWAAARACLIFHVTLLVSYGFSDSVR